MTQPKKLPAELSGRLGGLTAARNLGPEGTKARATKGGDAVLAKYGRAHMQALALRRRGYAVKLATDVQA